MRLSDSPGATGDSAIEEAEVMSDVDVGYLIQTMADSGKKSTRHSVQFADGSLAELTASSMALGEGTPSSLVGDQDAEPAINEKSSLNLSTCERVASSGGSNRLLERPHR